MRMTFQIQEVSKAVPFSCASMRSPTVQAASARGSAAKMWEKKVMTNPR